MSSKLAPITHLEIVGYSIETSYLYDAVLNLDDLPDTICDLNTPIF